MICPNLVCGSAVASSARFCPECGARIGNSDDRVHQGINTGGGSISGGVYQAGGDIHLGGESQEPRATYEPKWSWKSPLTLAVLTWISVIFGLLSLGSGYKVLESAAGALLSLGNSETIPQVQPIGMFVFLGFVVIFGGAMALRRITKNETQHFPSISWLPVLTGWGKRIGLARMKGICPIDGGHLRFYDKPIVWVNDPHTGKRRVT